MQTVADQTFMAVTEALTLAGDLTGSAELDTVLCIGFTGGKEFAVLGGDLDDKTIGRLQLLIDALSTRLDSGDKLVKVFRE